jgi:hypothetical protein
MLSVKYTLLRHCTKNSKQIFPEMKLLGIVPNFYIHVSVSDLHIPIIGLQTQTWAKFFNSKEIYIL